MPIVTRLGAASSNVLGTWTDLSNVLVQDDNTTSFTTTTKNDAREFEVSNFGFDSLIPVGATINSVTLRVRAASSSGGTHSYWIRVGSTDGSVNAPNAQSLTTNEHATSRPGGGDWTRDDLLNGTLTVRCRGVQPNNTSSRFYEFAWVEVDVDYTEPAGAITGTLAATLGALVLAAVATVAAPPPYYLLESGGQDGIVLEDGTSYLLLEDNWVTLETLGGTASSYSDTTAASSTTYEYRVVAVNDAGETPSNVVTGALLSTDAIGSLSQTLGALTASSSGFVSAWTVLDNTLGGSASSYSDTTAQPGTSYEYRVVAVNASGETPSNIVAAQLQPSVTGALSQTLGELTSASSGFVAIDGTSSATLGDLASTADGVVLVSGSSSSTFGVLTLDSSGSIGAGPVDGALSATLGALTSTATGEVAVSGTSSSTLGGLTLDSSGSVGAVPVTGTLSTTLGALTLSAAVSDWATLDTLGGSANSFSDTTAQPGTTYEYRVVAVNAQGETTSNVVSGSVLGVITGTLDVTLGELTGGLPLPGTTPGDIFIGPETMTVAGTLSATLGALTSTGAGTVAVSGTSSPTLGSLTVSAAGEVGSVPVTGELGSALGELAGASTGTVLVSGSTDATLGVLAGVSTGAVAVEGSVSSTLGPLTLLSTTGLSVIGASSQTLGPVTLQSQGGVQATGTSAVTLEPLTLSSNAVEGFEFVEVGSVIQLAGLGVFPEAQAGVGIAPTTVAGLGVTPAVGAGLGDVLRAANAGLDAQPAVSAGVGVFPVADAGLSDVQ